MNSLRSQLAEERLSCRKCGRGAATRGIMDAPIQWILIGSAVLLVVLVWGSLKIADMD